MSVAATLLRRRHRPSAPPEELRAPAVAGPAEGAMPIAEVRWRSQAKVTGHVRSLRVQPRAGVPTLEATLVDATGGLVVVFLGRRAVAGVRPGTRMVVEGMVGEHHGRLALLNPDYSLLAAESAR